MESDWKQRAEALFFGNGKNITEISGMVGVSVRSISKYFNTLPHYGDEVERRKKANQNRTAYYREYKRASRNGCLRSDLERDLLNVNYYPDGDSLKQEHITAVKILSRERYF